jgi:hypothetical protein
MVKVTIQNITKLSEDALYIQLDVLNEADDTAILIEAELDRRSSQLELTLVKKQQEQIRNLQIYHQIQSEIRSLFDKYRGKKTMFLVESLGQEFFDDYTVDESFTVRSLVAHNTTFDVPQTWECEDLQQANAKKIKLIYYRVYNKFMRFATQENLDLLYKVLGE